MLDGEADQCAARLVAQWCESRGLWDCAAALQAAVPNGHLPLTSDQVLVAVNALIAQHLAGRAAAVTSMKCTPPGSTPTADAFLQLSASADPDMLDVVGAPVSGARRRLAQDGESFPPVEAIRNRMSNAIIRSESAVALHHPRRRSLSSEQRPDLNASSISAASSTVIVDDLLRDQDTVDLDRFLDEIHQ
ncbi:LisH domain-containing protein [Plasmodiophora brassicae]|uniref:Uncharacterized protein n=1 Tax=Plasmodiophora brassicae TaxID=37360 RepID=A0A0G4IYV4_PLABS|nr:hypothetical protein PBRA_007935 [Plasmodiophora brassicae]SPQ96469.1 unnamed protein product [Plasmodiophora brassicae]